MPLLPIELRTELRSLTAETRVDCPRKRALLHYLTKLGLVQRRGRTYTRTARGADWLNAWEDSAV